jgi:hypothetical protein
VATTRKIYLMTIQNKEANGAVLKPSPCHFHQLGAELIDVKVSSKGSKV